MRLRVSSEQDRVLLPACAFPRLEVSSWKAVVSCPPAFSRPLFCPNLGGPDSVWI